MSTIVDDAKILSPCCQSFTTIDQLGRIICSACGHQCYEYIQDTDEFILESRSNMHKQSRSNDMYNVNAWHYAKNLYDDYTLKLCSYKCPDCGAYCRIARDNCGKLIMICTNFKCRHVWMHTGNIRLDNRIYTLDGFEKYDPEKMTKNNKHNSDQNSEED